MARGRGSKSRRPGSLYDRQRVEWHVFVLYARIFSHKEAPKRTMISKLGAGCALGLALLATAAALSQTASPESKHSKPAQEDITHIRRIQEPYTPFTGIAVHAATRT